jgi:Glyoxalase-like domain
LTPIIRTAAAITECWEAPAGEFIVEIQRVDHESRVHIDIETDDIRAKVARLKKAGAKVVSRLRRWRRWRPTGRRFCVVGFPKDANRWN